MMFQIDNKLFLKKMMVKPWMIKPVMDKTGGCETDWEAVEIKETMIVFARFCLYHD